MRLNPSPSRLRRCFHRSAFSVPMVAALLMGVAPSAFALPMLTTARIGDTVFIRNSGSTPATLEQFRLNDQPLLDEDPLVVAPGKTIKVALPPKTAKGSITALVNGKEQALQP
jgi:hypothetical protein